jgi:4a-hydroxytetrahydrobiopterin dehydratase
VSQLLPDLDVQRALGKLPGWGRKGTALSKTYKFATFRAGIDFVNRAAAVADRMDHHPDIDIRYTKIICTLSTHDAGGITQKDLNLATELDQLATDALG